jgi:tetratricopeptide (TPR) repeat protein
VTPRTPAAPASGDARRGAAGRGLVRHLRALLALAALGCGDPRASHAQGDLGAGRAALRAGRYDEAVRLLAAAAERPDASPDARRLHVRALAEVGRHDDAEAAARRYAARPDGGAALATILGEVLAARGRLGEAEQAFRRARKGGERKV